MQGPNGIAQRVHRGLAHRKSAFHPFVFAIGMLNQLQVVNYITQLRTYVIVQIVRNAFPLFNRSIINQRPVFDATIEMRFRSPIVASNPERWLMSSCCRLRFRITKKVRIPAKNTTTKTDNQMRLSRKRACSCSFSFNADCCRSARTWNFFSASERFFVMIPLKYAAWYCSYNSKYFRAASTSPK